MHTEDASVDDGAEGEVVEDLATPSPDVTAAVLTLTFVVEAVDLCDLSRLVVSADKGHAFRVSYFESEKEEECFDAVEAAVDEIACSSGSPVSVR